MATDFQIRSTQEELMDDLACEGAVVEQTLRELDFINKWLGGNEITVHALKEAWKTIPKEQTITIADLGCGSGEMLRIISEMASKENRTVRLIGMDANPQIVAYAQTHSSAYSNIAFEAINVFSEEFRNQKFDIVLATLFMHHFSKEELITLLSSLQKQTRYSIIINDIHRHPFAYYSIKWLTQLFSKSAMVKFDAPLSVLRSFKRLEWVEIMQSISQKDYSLSWNWAFRWKLVMRTKDY
jgi:2-polyprenyl-3-methyl-5-hydroxy-6-metoxy-1,4-benzoquinol methylase